MWELIFDIETKKLFGDDGATEPDQLGISIVSCYFREVDKDFREVGGQMKSFWDIDGKPGPQIEEMFELFDKADRIIGFNSLGFDVPALAPHYKKGNLFKLPHFDILAKVKSVLGHRLSLDAIAKETIGHSKIDVGTNAVKYWAAQDKESLDKLQKYCEMDVLVTRDVYDHGMQKKKLKYMDRWNELRELEVDFSYPAKPAAEPVVQMGLF